jgi:hypothetical protein
MMLLTRLGTCNRWAGCGFEEHRLGSILLCVHPSVALAVICEHQSVGAGRPTRRPGTIRTASPNLCTCV